MAETAVAAVAVPAGVATDRSVPTPAKPVAAGSASPAQVSIAPYALVRQTALALGQPSPASAVFRARAARLVALTAWCAQAGGPLGDALHGLIGSAPPDLRNRVLLPLRRDVHNQRTPRAALRERLPDLCDGLPLLASWLAARAEIDSLGTQLGDLVEPALLADRAALAQLCAAEPLQRAVALTSEDLLRAVQRAAVQGVAPDERARKSEATVLRYAMRVTTKTSPLSWFCLVGWGHWGDEVAGADLGDSAAVAVSQVNRGALGALLRAVLAHCDLRERMRFRLAPGLRMHGEQVSFRRQIPVDRGSQPMVGEEEVALSLTAPLRRVLALFGSADTMRPQRITADIAARLPGASERAAHAASQFVNSLIDEGMLEPAYPVDPQATDAVAAVCRWLAEIGSTELGSALAEIDVRTAEFANLPAVARPARLALLRSHWAGVFATIGAAQDDRPTLVTEDVTVRDVRRLGAEQGRDLLADLARLEPLFEIFDQYTVVRRAARNRFVDRFGEGGVCDSVAEFAQEYAEAWQALELLDPDRVPSADNQRSLDPQLCDLVRLRRELACAVPAIGDGEIVLPERVVTDAWHGLPAWVAARPSSYAVFAQTARTAGVTRLCVNHVYGGWGRFTSRFLDYLGPCAAAEVSAQIERGMMSQARVAQIRPVGGFNGNLHPLLVDAEIADEPPWGKYQVDDLQLVHDLASDHLRLRISATGELIDVLYLGFLVPIVLPDRLAPVLHDMASGLVDLPASLIPTRQLDTPLGPMRHGPRLRYRDVILARGRWRVSPAMVRVWRDELDREGDVPVRAAARWRALLGLPEKVFLGGAPVDGASGLEKLRSFFAQARSHYVDLGSALHLRCLSRNLARFPHGVTIEEALPEPRPGTPAVETVTELYRRVA